MLPSIAIILIGWRCFRNGYKDGTIIPAKDGAWIAGATSRKLNPAYPKFNAFVYSLEKFVPLVKLDMGDYWTPDADQKGGQALQRLLWFHISAGWVLTTLWAASITGFLKT